MVRVRVGVIVMVRVSNVLVPKEAQGKVEVYNQD